MFMRFTMNTTRLALIAMFLLAAPALAPTAAAAPGVVDCLVAPHIPETPTYYIAYQCTLARYAPEPIKALLGCTIEFQLMFHCEGGAVGWLEAVTGCEIGMPDMRC